MTTHLFLNFASSPHLFRLIIQTRICVSSTTKATETQTEVKMVKQVTATTLIQ